MAEKHATKDLYRAAFIALTVGPPDELAPSPDGRAVFFIWADGDAARDADATFDQGGFIEAAAFQRMHVALKHKMGEARPR